MNGKKITVVGIVMICVQFLSCFLLELPGLFNCIYQLRKSDPYRFVTRMQYYILVYMRNVIYST